MINSTLNKIHLKIQPYRSTNGKFQPIRVLNIQKNIGKKTISHEEIQKKGNTYSQALTTTTTTTTTNNNNKITGIINNWSLICLNINILNSQIKKHRLLEWMQKKGISLCCIQETHLNIKDRNYLWVKGFKKIYKQIDPRSKQV